MSRDSVIRACCAAFRVTEAQILGHRKHKAIAEARRVCAYFLRIKTDLEPGQIARFMNKSLAWTSWAFWAVQDQGEVDKQFAAKCQGIELQLKGIK